jgi:uncharacterized protein YcbX
MQTAPSGAVVALCRYPVKSMMGEDLNAVEITERGLVGDRQFAVIDPSTGKVAGAKNPRKWATSSTSELLTSSLRKEGRSCPQSV